MSAPRSAQPARDTRYVSDIPSLIATLSSRSFAQRRQATEHLKSYGPEAYAYFVRAYRSTRSPEVRLRIKQIAAHIYVREQAGTEEGFLGIQPHPVTHEEDDRLHPGETGVIVVRVIENTAAERVGLRPDDMIIRFNRNSIPAGLRGQAFTQMVRALPPNTLVPLVTLRGKERLILRVRLSARPPGFRTAADVETTHRACARWFHDRFEPPPKPPDPTETVRADAAGE